MGAFLDTPKVDKETERFENEKLSCAVSSMQGWRIDMEDAHTLELKVDGHTDWSWFAVYDGHGGSLVANTSAAKVLPAIQGQDSFKAAKTNEEFGEAIRTGFLLHDDAMRSLPEVKNGVDHSGCTAIGCMVTPTHFIVANCGDSRLVLSRGKGGEVWGTQDHKPNLPAEKARIEAAGGCVSMRRVNGDLAVSRALGDFLYKHRDDLPAQQQQVSPEPTIDVLPRTDKDDYLIICCDGIWDVMSNQEVVDFVRGRVLEGEMDLGVVAENLLDHCLALNSRDNMTALIVRLPGAEKPSPAKIEKYNAEKKARMAAASASSGGGAGGGAGKK